MHNVSHILYALTSNYRKWNLFNKNLQNSGLIQALLTHKASRLTLTFLSFDCLCCICKCEKLEQKYEIKKFQLVHKL